MKRMRVILFVMIVALVLTACKRSSPPGDGPGGPEATAGGVSRPEIAGTPPAAPPAGQSVLATAPAVQVAGTVTALAAAADEFEPTAQAAFTEVAGLAATVEAVVGAVALPAAAGFADAATVIPTYASEVLGIEVSIVQAGGLTGEVARTLSLPAAALASTARAETVAFVTSGALLSNGAASVSYGSGMITGDVTVDIQSASLGAFSLQSERDPQSEAEALALVQATFPAIADRAYTPYSVPQGFAWFFEGQTPGYENGQATLVAEAILVGVERGERGTLVYAVVGRGTLAQEVNLPGG